MTYDAEAFDRFERETWQAKARAYAERITGLTARAAGPLLDAAGVGEGTRLVDVGTGPGVVAGLAVRRGARVIGVDAAPAMIERARLLVPQCDFRVGTAEALPLSDREADAGVGGFVLLHLARPEAAVAELLRVVRPGKRIALSVWDSLDRTRALGVFADACEAGGAVAPPELPPGPAFTRFADEEAFAGLLRDAGFEQISVTREEWDHVVDPAEWWDAIVAGSARTGALIAAQEPEVGRRIREAYDELVSAYAEPGGRVALPAVAVIGSATRPST